MPEHMKIVITLRKPVADHAAAVVIYNAIKAKVAEYPDVTVTGNVVEQLPTGD